MNIEKICSRPARTIASTATVRRVAIEMLAHHVGALVVVDGDGVPRGVVTDRDIVLRCLARENDPDEMAVSEIMSEPIETIHGDADLERALETMAEREVRRLVVKDDTDEVIGVLSFDDVLDALADAGQDIAKLLERRQPV